MISSKDKQDMLIATIEKKGGKNLIERRDAEKQISKDQQNGLGTTKISSINK